MSEIRHSAKGTHWEKKNHKYTKKVDVMGKMNYVYDKATSAYNEVTADNELIMDSSNYDEQMAKVARSKEWQDIVRRNDPEYVRKNADGTKSYLIDDFVAKKKHPVLDVLDDAVSGRKLTVNKINKKSVIAAGDDIVKRYASYLAIGVKGLLSGSKVRQGSYDKEIAEAKTTANQTIKTSQTIANSTNVNTGMRVVNEMLRGK